MDLTEEDFLNAITSEEAFRQAISAKTQGWYSLFYREKDRLLHRIRQNQALCSTEAPPARTRNPGQQQQQVIALAAEYAHLEKLNDLINQAADLRDTAPNKAQHVIGNNKAQRVLGGEAPRAPRPRHRKSSSWQDQSGAPPCRTQEAESSEDDSEKERERLAHDLAEGRRMIEENLQRLVRDESGAPPPIPTRRRSCTMDSSPKSVRFDVPDPRRDSEASGTSRLSGVSHASGNSSSSASSRASGGSQASGASYGSVSSYASEREQPTKAMKMLGIRPKRNP